MGKLKVLDLFSGIGGFSLGLEATGGFETVAFCEIDAFCQKVLRKHWPDVPIYEDVRTLDYDGPVDLICGGYPCQPFSLAGKREGTGDDRHLWPAMFDLVKKHRPAWVIGENVAGHITMGLDDVLSNLEREDYACRPIVIPACAVYAPHRRDRVWVIANDRRKRIKGVGEGKVPRQPGVPCCEDVRRAAELFFRPDIHRPKLRRVVNGISERLDSVGNSVIPQAVQRLGEAILSTQESKEP